MLTIILTVASTLVLVLLDRLMKMWAVAQLQPVGSQPLIPGFLGLRYVENTGAAFNALEGKQIFLIVLTTIALLAVAFVLFVRRPKNKLELVSLTLIFGGGVGNFIDRVTQGYVVDCFEFQFVHFAVFNLADVFVVVGTGLLLLALILQEVREHKEKKQATTTAPAAQEPDNAEH